jgi:ABC-2 type transport system permease protein
VIIAAWEFAAHIKTRSFLLATFISPVIFAAILLLPSLFYQASNSTDSLSIGYVEFDSTRYFELLVERLNDTLDTQKLDADLELIKVEADTSEPLAQSFLQRAQNRMVLDSLDDSYNKIKEKRKYVFQRPASNTRERQLKETYEQLHVTRESRDLAIIEHNRIKSLTDSSLRSEVIKKADSLLTAKLIQGYIVIEPESIEEGKIEFHSLLPINFLRINRLKQILQVVLVEERMKEEGVTSSKIGEWLKPIEIHEFRLEGSEKREFNMVITYLVPIIVIIFLFISIFTSSGFFYSGIVAEKSNHIVEFLLSSVKPAQIIAGKILAMGLLGILQILIWVILTVVLILTDGLKIEEVGFLSVQNAGIFTLYYILGYLLFAALFLGIGSIFPSQERSHNLDQLIRVVSIFPIVLAVLVLESPNSLLVRILSFIPFLTPTFMVLRTPLGDPPILDYGISVLVMLVSISVLFSISGKIFRIGSLKYNERLKLKDVFVSGVSKNRKTVVQ